MNGALSEVVAKCLQHSSGVRQQYCYSIDFAIGDRPLGSHAAVGVTRAGKEIVADVALTTPEQF